MAAISWSVVVDGTLEQAVAAASAPGAGHIEIRMDQTATTVTDAAYAGSLRAPRKGEILTAIETLKQAILRDPNILE